MNFTSCCVTNGLIRIFLGSFKGEPPVSRVSPVIKDIKGRFNFVPTLNYHGPFNASFAGVNLVRHSNDVPIRSLQMSPHVSLIIDIVSLLHSIIFL